MVAKVPLTIACGDYDRVAAIKDGRVEVEGCEVTFIPMEPEEVFFRAFRFQEFDCCELSFSSFMIVTARNESPFVGIPAFVSRVFRHSGIYIRTDKGIEKPEDLRGKTVGLPEYQMTAPVWMRGMLEDEYGVKPNEIHWRSGGQEEAGRDERTPLVLTNGVDLQPIRRTRPWSSCSRRASWTRCSPPARRRASSRASPISRACSPTTGRSSGPIGRRPSCSRSCT